MLAASWEAVDDVTGRLDSRRDRVVVGDIADDGDDIAAGSRHDHGPAVEPTGGDLLVPLLKRGTQPSRVAHGASSPEAGVRETRLRALIADVLEREGLTGEVPLDAVAAAVSMVAFHTAAAREPGDAARAIRLVERGPLPR